MYNARKHCLVCDTLNNLLVRDTDSAYECYGCHSRHWLDDQARLEHMVHNNRSLPEAENDLIYDTSAYRPSFAVNKQ